MSQKEAQLIIRAKDEARKTLKEATSALRDMLGAQEDLAKSASKTDTMLGRLGAELVTLNKEIKGLSALSKVSQQLDTATGSITRLENSLKRSKGNTAELVAQYGKLAVATGQLRQQAAQSADALARQTETTKSAKGELSQLDREVKKAESSYGRLFTQLQKVKEPNETLKQKYREQRDSLIGLHTAQEKATSNYQKQSASLTQIKQANSELASALKVAESQQAKLRTEAVRATTALAAQRVELGKARAELSQVSSTVRDASKALGSTGADQAAISKAAQKAATDLDKVTKALERQRTAQAQAQTATPLTGTSEISKQAAAYRAQVQAVDAAKAAFRSAQLEAGKLATAMKAAAQPTRELQTAYTLAQEGIQSARAEMNRQVAALDALRSKTRTFIDFQKAAAQSISGTSTSAASEFFKLNTASQRATDALGGTAAGANKVRGAFAAMYGESRQSLSLLQRIRGEVLSLTASYLGLYAAINQLKSVVDAYRALEAVQSRLGVAFNQNTKAVGKEVDFLRQQAIRLGVSFEVLGNEYSKFTVATTAANFSMADTRRIFLSVAEAARVNKLSTEQMSGVFLALQQMISKGKVSSEELRRQLGDRLAGAFHLFAAGLKMTTAELDAALRKGEIFSTDTTMLAFADELTKKFGNQLPTALESLTTQMGRFEALLFDMKMRIAEGGFAEALRVSIDDINEAMQSEAGDRFVKSLSEGLINLVKVLRLVIDNFDLLIAAGKIFLAVKLTQFVLGLAGTFGTLNNQLIETVVRARTAQAGLTSLAASGTYAGLKGLTGIIAGANAQLAVLPGRAAAARVGLTTLVAGATALRGAFVTLAATARALWVAIGGLPGLILTGVTVIVSTLVGDWQSGIERATQALEEHEQLIQKVRTAYDGAAGDVNKFAQAVTGLTPTRAGRNLDNVKQALQDIRDSASAPSFKTGLGIFMPGSYNYNTAVGEVYKLVKAFKEGKVSAADFEKQLDAIYQANKELDGESIDGLLKVAEQAKKAEEEVKKAEAIVRVAAGTFSETDKAALGLADAVEKAEDKFKESVETTEKYNDAIGELRKMIPELKAEMDRLGEIKAIDDLIKGFKDLNLEAGKYKELLDLANRAKNSVNSQADDKLISGSKLADKIAGIESGGNPNAKNPNSTATGLGQFIESTWLAMFKKYFPDQAAGMTQDAILELRKNAEISKQMIELYAAENAKAFREAGVAVNDAALYLAHFLGPGGATKLLQADGNTPVSQILGQDQINANASILQGKTAAEVVAWAQKKVGISERELAITNEINDLENDKLEKQKEFHEGVAEGLRDKENELTLLSQEARQREITKALQEAQNEAKKAGTELTKEEIAAITDKTGKLWDANNLETIANGLMEKRAALLDKLRTVSENGDTAKTQELNIKLGDVNLKLQEAINKAIAFWTSIGGPEAATKLESLKALNAELAKTPTNVSAANAATNKMATDINNYLVDGLGNAFDSFAQAVANGENVFDALKQSFLQFAASFLQQIAKMIIQQALLNALGMNGAGGSTGGVGGGIAGIIGGLFHEGGVVGQGGQSMLASPSWFRNAPRYHGGGMAGLKPNEVPAILERNEEVLTTSDPRHAFNGGGGSGAMNVKVVNAIDAGDFVSKGLNSEIGEKAILNFIRSNSDSVKSAMGV